MATPKLVRVRISPTIGNEYAVRSVFNEGYELGALPGDFDHGVVEVTTELARAMLEDAKFQIDRDGPFGDESTREDVPIKLAYRALVKQLSAALEPAPSTPKWRPR